MTNEQLQPQPEEKLKFAYDSFPIPPEDVRTVAQIRKLFSDLSKELDKVLPYGRYKSIVETQLETAQMFSVKAITHHTENLTLKDLARQTMGG
jgi:hypothetical protein